MNEERAIKIAKLFPPPSRTHGNSKGPNEIIRRDSGIVEVLLKRQDGVTVCGLVDGEVWDSILSRYRWFSAHLGRPESEWNQWRMVANLRVRGKRSRIYAHRLIMIYYGMAPCVNAVDHIRHRPPYECVVDNLRRNLRPTDYSANGHNRRSANEFTGICKYRCTRWKAQIRIEGRKTHLGVFDTAKEAARAYDVAAAEYFQEYANLNFEHIPF